MTRSRPARASAAERGASAVEFALILPVLMLLIFGLIAFGFIFAQQLGLNNAARDATRAGVVQPLGATSLTCSGIAALARTSASGNLGMNPSAVAVTVTGPLPNSTTCALAAGSATATGSGTTAPCIGSTGGQLQVSLSYVSRPPVGIGGFSTFNLSAIGRFQCEYAS
jgi:Flp pilus assembly protein TadG